MATTNVTTPLVNGDGSQFSLSLNLPAPIPAGIVTWASTAHTGSGNTGTITPSNDGKAALYTVSANQASADTETITATITTGAGGVVAPWAPKRFFRLNDKILDQNGHVQQVTATTKFYPSVYTPYAGDVPQGGDSTQAGNQYGGTLVSGTVQFGTVLNQGSGTNGDWPAGATAANSGNIKTPYPTTAAAVTYVGAGYSGDGARGIDSPVPIVAWQPNTSYAYGSLITDENGNIQEVTKAGVSGTQYPIFSASSTTIDNTVTWTYQSAGVNGYSNANILEIATYTERGNAALGSFVLTAVASSSNGVATYTGTFAGGASNAYAGFVFKVSGFTTAANNGNFLCTASSTTSLTLNNASAVAQTHAGTAVNSGTRSYIDAAGNIHIGWQVAAGTVEFAEPAGIPPAFSTTGGTTIDHDLTWTDQGAAATTSTKAVTITLTAGASVPLGYFALLG